MDKSVLITLDKFEEAEQYWLDQLAGQQDVKLPIDFPRAGQYERANHHITFGRELSQRILTVSKQSDLGTYIVLLTAFKILLFKYTGQENIIAASPIYSAASEKYNKYVTFRTFVDAGLSFKELLVRVKKTVVEGYKKEYFPFDQLMELLKPGEELSLFRVALGFESIHKRAFLEDLTRDFENELTLFALENQEELEAEIIYNSKLYKKETVERFTGHYLRILRQVLDRVDIPVKDIQWLSEEEKSQVLSRFNSAYPDMESPAYPTIHELFQQQAAKTPDRRAVLSEVDLSDVLDELKSMKPGAGDAAEARLLDRLSQCCFEKIPHLYERDSSVFHDFTVLKTPRHHAALVNSNMLELLNIFDGNRNIRSIFFSLKSVKAACTIFALEPEDVLEVVTTFSEKEEILLDGSAGNFLRALHLLYINHLIELAGMNSRDVDEAESSRDRFDPGIIESKIDIESIFDIKKELSPAPVLLLGDTPGTATTGLLYLASYLKRNGVDAYCQFYSRDPGYEAMEKTLEKLLKDIRPRIVAISMKWFLHIARVLEICRIVKNHSPGITVVVGGNTASYYWQEFIAYDFIDYVIRGEGEVPLLEICRGSGHIPNSVYKDKEKGKIIENPITYIEDESNAAGIYLSHLDEVLLSPYAPLFGTFFIYTHKGCGWNCLYCGGCNEAQQETFNRKKMFNRPVEAVRKDIIEAKKFASTLMFDLDGPNERILAYCKKIWQGIDLKSYFCIFTNVFTPSPALIDFVNRTFKYVYWNLDIASLSERHRKQLVSLGRIKPQPSDAEILAFFDACERYDNAEVRINMITGLPYFNREDITSSEKILSYIMDRYRCFSELHWARLHAQPGASVTKDAGTFHMYTQAAGFEDFFQVSRSNYELDTGYPGFEYYNYPYIYFIDDALNSRISQYHSDTNRKVQQFKESKQRKSFVVEGLTYRELNESADRLAQVLQGKGVGRESHAVVGVSMHNSLELAVSLLGIMKAGGAYMPIAPEYPEQRKKYMIEDSGIRVLVTGSLLVDTLPEVSVSLSMVLVDDPQMSAGSGEKPECPVLKNHPGSGLAYVIYTSGTTGKPKGVAVEHRGIVNYTHWRLRAYGYTEEDVTLQLLSNSFDGFGSNFYSGLLSGGTLIMVPEMIKLDVRYITGTIRENRITNISLVPGMYRLILDNAEAADLGSLRFVILAGESSGPDLIRLSGEKAPHARLINEYGPTEATVTAAAHIGMDESSSRVIGKPIANVQIYILDKFLECVPVGVPGELCIGGIGLARGYLNRPELTTERFIEFHRSYRSYRSYISYRTGDLARWLPDGTIEFAGRIDHQVKIRGFRVEPAEVENQLLEHSEITGAVVLIKQDERGETDLCAYIVSNNPLPVSEIRDYLSDKLPLYMVPRFIVQIDQIPLTVNGKIDRRVLPEPESKAEGIYMAPANRVEEQLVVIWSEVLGMEEEKISVDANFFQLGGHSLRATIMITKVHKALDVKIPLAEVFKNPTIRGLAEMIKGAEEDRYVSIEPALEKEYYPLSSAQERLYVLQQLAPESTLYNMPIVVELGGEVAGEKLEKTFSQLIQRHESLRTSFTRVEEQPVQKVHAPHDVAFKIQHYNAGTDEEVNRLINHFMGPFDLSQAPLMKVGMVKRNDKRYILMVVMHHIIADGLSIGILVNEFMTLYRGGTLPPLRLQYKDFSQWQNRLKQGEGIKKQETYWLKVFSGDIPVLKMPFDNPRSAQLDIEGDAVTFDLGAEIAGAVKELALQQGATLFMVLLAVYCVLLSKLSGQEDIVVGTAVAGRNHPDLEPVIGMFLNTLAIRTFPKGEKAFKEFLAEVIDTTLQAYANQDYPFEDLVEKVVVNREANRHPLFDVGFGIQNIDVPTAAAAGTDREPREPEVALKSYHFEDKTAKFDMNMLGSEAGENVFFTIEYSTNLFKKETIERFINYYKRLAASVIENPDRKITEMEIITAEESMRILSKKEEDEHAIRMDFDL